MKREMIDRCRYSIESIGDGMQGVTIVMPAGGIPCQLEGNEARKRMVKWTFANADGFLQMIGLFKSGFLYGAFTSTVQWMDREYQRELDG